MQTNLRIPVYPGRGRGGWDPESCVLKIRKFRDSPSTFLTPLSAARLSKGTRTSSTIDWALCSFANNKGAGGRQLNLAPVKASRLGLGIPTEPGRQVGVHGRDLDPIAMTVISRSGLRMEYVHKGCSCSQCSQGYHPSHPSHPHRPHHWTSGSIHLTGPPLSTLSNGLVGSGSLIANEDLQIFTEFVSSSSVSGF